MVDVVVVVVVVVIICRAAGLNGSVPSSKWSLSWPYLGFVSTLCFDPNHQVASTAACMSMHSDPALSVGRNDEPWGAAETPSRMAANQRCGFVSSGRLQGGVRLCYSLGY
jgi:hypothetical protein